MQRTFTLSHQYILLWCLGRGPELSLLLGRALNEAGLLFDKPHTGTWLQIEMLPGSDSWSLYLSVVYPIRVSPSIAPCIQRMRTAFRELCSHSCPGLTLLIFWFFSLSLLITAAHTQSILLVLSQTPNKPVDSAHILLLNSIGEKVSKVSQIFAAEFNFNAWMTEIQFFHLSFELVPIFLLNSQSCGILNPF